MKKIFKTVAALAVVMFAGCTNDFTNDVVAPIEGETTVVGVGFDETKTYLGELVDGYRKVYWSEGDQITINGNASNAIKISDSKTYAEFNFNGNLNYPYSVLYPASAYVDASTINLPATQEAADGTFATNTAPMACVAEEGDAIALHHLTSVVRLQVTLPAESEHAAHKLAKVEFRGKADEQVSGKFAIDYATATLTATSTAEEDKVVTTKVNKTLSTEATDIFVVVPARTYEQGFTVRLIDSNGHYMDIATNAITLTKGDVKAMPPFDFAPTGTIVGVEIASAEGWNNFVAEYKGGYVNIEEKFEVKIINDLDFTGKSLAEIDIFNHTLDGGNFSIKNWKNSNNAVVNQLSAGATVKNLNIDSSSSFKFTNYWWQIGVFVRNNYGTLQGCTNNADITIVNTENKGKNHCYGTLVGKNYNNVTGCTNNGNLTINSDVVFQGTPLNVGGVVGYNEGQVTSTNNGALTVAGDNGAQTANYIGGIAGENKGTVSGCTNGINAAIATTLKANRNVVGGIVGWNNGTCTQNINNATVDCSPTEYVNNYAWAMAGGIAGGILSGTVNSNTNNGSVSVNTDLAGDKSHVGVGGIAGTLDSNATDFELKHNNVTSAATISSTTSAVYRRSGVGGLIGNTFNNKSTLDFVGDTGKIECKIVGGQNTRAAFGGVVGIAYDAIKIKNVTNCACVITMTQHGANAAAGGIVGKINNAAGAEVSGCTYKGDITVTNASQQSLVGGIAGWTEKAITISNCKYYGALTVGSTKPVVGGIIGYEAVANTISDCSYGGVINGVTVNTDALALQYFAGQKTSAPTNITYWDGN